MKGFSFATKLIAGVITIQTVIVVVLLWNSARFIENSNLEVYEHSAHEIISAIADSLAPVISLDEKTTLAEFIATLEESGHFEYLVVKNDQGKNVASFGSIPVFSEENTLDVTEPITDESGKELATLRVGFVTSHAGLFTSDAWRGSVSIALFVVFFSALITAFVAWFYTRNLRKLREGTEAMICGDLSKEIKIDSHDEVEEVAKAVNRLASYLGKSLLELNQFKDTLDNTLDCVFMFVPDTLKLIYVNQGAIEQVGYTREELLNMSPVDIKPEFSERSFREVLAPMLTGKKQTHMFETVHKCKDGNLVPVEIFLQYVSTAGEEGRFVAIVRDITERKKVERALLKAAEGFSTPNSEEFFAELAKYLANEMEMDYSFVGEFLKSKDMVATMAVCAKGNIVDNFEYDLKGAPCRNVIGGDICYYTENIQRQFPEDTLLVDMEIESYIGVPLLSKEGAVMGLMVLLDTKPLERPTFVKSMLQIFSTRAAIELERAIADRALRASRERLARAQQIAGMGDWEWDMEKNTMRWSDQMYRTLSLASQEKPASLSLLLELAHHKDRAELRKSMQGAGSEWLTADLDYRLKVRKGPDRTVHIHAEVVVDDSGKVMKVVGTLQDITRRKSEENTLMQRQKLESLGVLTGGVAHDFNNILASIMGNANLAMEDISKDSPAHECLEDVILSSKRAADLAGQMLAYSGQGKFSSESINLSDLVSNMTRLVSAATPKHVVVKYELSGDIPPIDADANQMRQVVMNLVINAAEAIGDAGGTVTVSTGTVDISKNDFKACIDSDISEGTYVFAEVLDDGEGMDAETVSKIFDPFFTTKFIGRGLGLAAALGIARGHGGTISVKSDLGAGACFRVFYPVAITPPEKKIERHLPPRKQNNDNGNKIKTVLVVDDDSHVLDATIRMLKKAGYNVIPAHDGGEAISVFRDQHKNIDLVLMDVNMPVLRGEDAFEQMCEIQSTARVILTSGYSVKEASSRFKDAPPAGFIQKPYTYKDLVNKLKQVLTA
ncbi:Chemotaxis protein methyltransferase CheR [hydrothermal vent metagenome]|uniref:histidine kinase n=1 Tax=hydrothermal vent metagenome TaxID=652676 RepID=A0A3B1CRW8_9ZZZZ